MSDEHLTQSQDSSTQKCPRIDCVGRPSPEDAFCRVCGTSLNPERDNVRRIIEQTISEKFADRSLVELDLAQTVRSRLLSNAQTYSYIIGIPLAIFGLALATVGITNYQDFASQLEKKGQEAITTLEKDAAEISAKAQHLEEQYANQERALAKFIDEAPVLERAAEKVANLQKRVEAIEIFGKKARPVHGDDQVKAERAMKGYRTHLQKLGLNIQGNPGIYTIEKDDSNYNFTFYDPVERRIALGSDWDIYGLLVMYGHYALTPVAPSSSNLTSNLFSGALSDYLAWSYLKKVDFPALARWSTSTIPERNLGEMISNLELNNLNVWNARTLIKVALLDAEEKIGADELGHLTISTWSQFSKMLVTQKPNEAVRAFVHKLGKTPATTVEINSAFAKVGLLLNSAE